MRPRAASISMTVVVLLTLVSLAPAVKGSDIEKELDLGYENLDEILTGNPKEIGRAAIGFIQDTILEPLRGFAVKYVKEVNSAVNTLFTELAKFENRGSVSAVNVAMSGLMASLLGQGPDSPLAIFIEKFL